MFSETFKTEDGQEKTVYASTKEELATAVQAAKEVKPATYPNINVPVKKGHDKLEIDEALNTHMVDGTGAHNSPRDAVRDDGKVEGDPDVKPAGIDEKPYREQGTGKETDEQKPVEGDKVAGTETKDSKVSDKR